MRTMLISALAVLVATLGICCWGIDSIDETVDEMSDMALQLMHYAEMEAYADAQDIITIMANAWQRALPVLNLLTDHDDLHEIGDLLAESEVFLKFRHANDFYHSMALLDESLQRLRENERLTLGNLL